MATDVPLATLLADAGHRVPDPPPIDDVIEDAGRQRLAAYYLYSALLAGVLSDADLAPGRWPSELAEPMQRLGLSPVAPHTGPGLDAQLTPAEQGTRRSPGRALEFARLLVDLINSGTFGPLCGNADSVRLAAPVHGSGQALELIKDGHVVSACAVRAHWELVAQHLAGAPRRGHGGTGRGSDQAVSWLKSSGLGHAVSLGTTLAVHLHPLGAAAGLGTRLVEARIQGGRGQADALRRLGEELGTLRAAAASEIARLQED